MLRCASTRFSCIVRCHQTAALRPKRRWKHQAGLLPSMPNPPKEEHISVPLLPQVQKGKFVVKSAGIPLLPQQSVAKEAPSHKPAHNFTLEKWYRRNHSEIHGFSSAAFEASIVEEAVPGQDHTKKWHTATFICPITGHAMASGTIRATDMGEIKVIAGKIYYERITWAKTAACSRMMDSIQYTISQQIEPRDCEENPITLPSKLFQYTPRGVTPANALNNAYHIFGINNAYKLAITVTETDKGWTASFTCPRTGYTVGAGVVRRGSEDAHVIADGVVYFKEEREAKHAAAARFLDNLRYTETKEIEPRLCEEVPSLIENYGIEKLFTASDLSVENTSARKVYQKEDKAGTMMRAIVMKTRTDEVTNYDSFRFETPKSLLNIKYQKAQIPTSLKRIEVMKTDKGWTASFSCPLTGYIVKAGTLRGAEDFYVRDKGVVYYTKPEDAKHALAAQFLDNLQYTETGESEPRWCEEIPSVIKKTGIRKLFNVSDSPVQNTGLEELPTPDMLSDVRPSCMDALYRETKISKDGADFSVWMGGGTPKALLNSMYDKSGIRGALKSIVLTDTEKGSTASFTCPVTGYTAKAGALRGTKDFYIVEEGVVYYTWHKSLDYFPRDKSGAEHAAAARFLDDLRYTQTKEIEPRWCEEVPSLIKESGIKDLFTDRRGKDHDLVQARKLASQPEKERSATVYSETKMQSDDINFSSLMSSSTPRTRLNILDQESQILGDLKGTEVTESDKDRPSSPLQIEAKEDQGAYGDNLVALAYPPSFSWNAEKQETSQSPSDLLHPSPQELENEEELTIHNISAFKPVGTSTLERVMEALGETVTTNSNPSEGTEKTSRGPIQTTPTQQKKKVIEDTIAWYRRLAQQEKPEERGYAVFQTATLPMTARSAAAAIRVLAKAHWSHPSEDPETDQRVEYAAKQMLDLTWTAGRPSADAYNSYLLCLARSSAAFEAAQAGELILRAMIERQELDGRLLPEPNIDTFNAAIQLWAATGGSTGFSKCEEIFQLMEQEREKGHELHPTRDTFLSVLSSLARPSSVDHASSFDRERAQHWIERMRRQGEDNNDGTLTPDTQVFNAPLRWIGGNESSRSRPFTQGLSWDKYSALFKEGFRPLKEEDPLWIEARRIEEWLHEMETIGPAPDVETFEAAIQAWTRTGMADGLRRAELVALRAIASDKLRPRLQSFHPLFAAWAFSGDERGPKKIQEWITRLEEKGRTFPETKPDTRMQTSLYIAKRNQQKTLLVPKDETSEGPDIVDSLAKATQIAESCLEDLGQLAGQIRRKRNDPKDVDGFVDPSIFSHTLCAWGDVAVARVNDSRSDGATPDGMAADTQKILGVVKKYDDVIQHLRTKKAAQHESSEEHLHFDIQLEQFLRHSQTVYLNALTYLNEMDRQRKNQGIQKQRESSVFYQRLFDVESMLRRAEELRMTLDASTQSSSATAALEDVTLVYDDLFSYPSDVSDALSGKSYREKQIALYSEIVDGCKRMEGSDCFGDSVRLCMLIVDFLQHAPPTGQAADCTNIYLGIISVVENIPNEHERYQVRRRIFHSVNSSPFTIDKDAIMAVIPQKEALRAVKDPKKPARARRPVKRQRWRTASQS